MWERRLDPTSELILTILTQNSADTNAEVAFEALRRAYPGSGPVEAAQPGRRLGRARDSPDGTAPDWARVEFAPLPELIDVIRPGGLANQKAPRLQATLRTIREERGDYSLEFLGDMTALEARDWLTRIDGIGKKTASVLLLFCFGQPLMPIDRHVERVMRRVGVLPPKTDRWTRRHDLVPRPVRARRDVRGPRQLHPARPQGLPRPAAGPRRLPAPAALSVRRPQGALTLRHDRRIRTPRPLVHGRGVERARSGPRTDYFLNWKLACRWLVAPSPRVRTKVRQELA